VRQFVEIINCLYQGGKISKQKIVELFVNGKITEEEKWYILNVK
jgi:hypothetical protein